MKNPYDDGNPGVRAGEEFSDGMLTDHGMTVDAKEYHRFMKGCYNVADALTAFHDEWLTGEQIASLAGLRLHTSMRRLRDLYKKPYCLPIYKKHVGHGLWVFMLRTGLTSGVSSDGS